MDQNASGWALFTAPDRDATKLAQAIDCFEAALAEDPDHGPATANLLDALAVSGREGEAVERAGAIVERGAGSRSMSRAHNWLGWYYANAKKDLPRALDHFDRATTLGGWWGVAHLNYGMTLELSGNLDKALDEYAHALKSGDAHDPALAHARCGAIQYQRGWLRHALSSSRRAIVREERGPRGRLDTWRADAARIENELNEKKLQFPREETERAWIELEIAQKREGLGVDRRTKLSQLEREWLAYEDRCAEDIPTSGELAPLEELLRAQHFDEAIDELARLRAKDTNLIIDAIGLTERYGEQAAAAGRHSHAVALLGFALDGYRMHASGSTSGGDGMERMLDVRRLQERLAALRKT